MKQEFPPLLNLGFHPHTFEELRNLCVARFPFSKTRPTIINNLEIIVSNLRKSGIEGEIWVDGSLLTEKINPEDSDILFHYSGESYDTATTAQRQLVNVLNTDLKPNFMCDSYALPYYPKGHQWYDELEWWKAYWLRQFGFSRKDQPKGLAVIRL